MNIAKAVSGSAPRQLTELEDVARKSEAIGCRMRRSIKRGDAAGVEKALRELRALCPTVTGWAS